jgi:alpha-galactosidase
MWDELLTRHPGLMIDNCSSGGRRIDLEMCSRSVPLWRSDTSCSPGHADWNQAQVAGLSQYVVLQTACAWTPAAYDVRSAQTGGLITQLDYRAPDFPTARAQALLAEAKANQKYWYGDFYVLTRPSAALDHWCAYQAHRTDLGGGVVYVYRRTESPYPLMELAPRGLAAEARYRVELITEALEKSEREMTGAELQAGLEVRVPRGESLLVRYQRLP